MADDANSGKATLSIKVLEADEHKKAIADYGGKLGDILGATLNEAVAKKQ